MTSNVKRGKSRAALRANVEDALRKHWYTHSDRQLAQQLGVSNRTVSKYRKQMEARGEILPQPKSTQGTQPCHHEVCTSAVRPSSSNDDLYSPVNTSDPDFQALVKSIRKDGILSPIGVSADGFIFNGHRRYQAARCAGLVIIPILIHRNLEVDSDRFIALLAASNQQRTKTSAEVMREQVALDDSSPRHSVREHRRHLAEISGVSPIDLGRVRNRSLIVEKRSLANAITQVVAANREEWPLSDRRVFYLLLNVSGLVRNDRLQTPFVNDANCYDDVTDLLTRLRLSGDISFAAIADETRPVIVWKTYGSIQPFVAQEMQDLFSGYSRDLLQSQPNHVELLVEKNTVASTLRRLASHYTLPLTSGRGYSSLPPRYEMVRRFKVSGKDKLVIVCVSDFDPEGEDIPAVFGRSIRDDFEVPEEKILVVKSALTYEQVTSLELHAGQLAKADSSRYDSFVERYGDRCWELESLSPDLLRELVESTIRGVLDLDAFEAEVEREKTEREELANHKESLRSDLDSLDSFA